MRYELSDNEWGIIRAMLPTKPRGIPRVDDRRVLNGIFWVLRSGAPWRDLPTIYGPRTTCYNRFVRWRRAGIWDRILQALTRAHDAAVQMIDTSMVRVHQHACIADSGNQAVGRSRGGLTSKLHVVVDGKGLPLRLGITAGQVHDNRLCSTLLSGLTPRTMVLADRGYDADWIRALVNEQGAWANIPEMQSPAAHLLQSLPLSCAQPRREVLQQDQALPTHRNSLRQTRGQLPGVRPAGINPPLAARL